MSSVVSVVVGVGEKHVFSTKLVWIMFESYVRVCHADKVSLSVSFLWIIISSKGTKNVVGKNHHKFGSKFYRWYGVFL